MATAAVGKDIPLHRLALRWHLRALECPQHHFEMSYKEHPAKQTTISQIPDSIEHPTLPNPPSTQDVPFAPYPGTVSDLG